MSVSKRSTLFSIEPRGLNTPFVESLSSYICRLAEAHNVSVSCLMQKILFPELQSCPSILEGKKGRLFDGFQVNGLGITTLDFVNVLERLTSRSDIHFLTLLNYTAFFPVTPKNFIVRSKRWCPMCFKESKDRGEIVYEPLLWQLEDYQNCLNHRCVLQSRCWNCQKEIKNFFASTTLIGRCPYCNVCLGDQDISDISIAKEQICSASHFYCELIENNFTSTYFPTRIGIKHLMIKIEESKVFRPYRSSAEIFSLNLDSLKSWIYGISLPSSYFYSLLNHYSEVSINKLFIDNNFIDEMIKNLIQHLNRNNHKRKDVNKNRNKISQDRIYEVLKSHLESEKYSIGIMKLSEQNGFCATTARRYFPELCTLIVRKHSNYKKKEKEILKNKLEAIAADPRNRDLCVKDVAKDLGISPSYIKSNFPHLNRIIISKHREYKKENKNYRLTYLKKNIHDAILHLHNNNIYPSEDKIVCNLPNTQKCVFIAYPQLRAYKRSVMKQLGYDC